MLSLKRNIFIKNGCFALIHFRISELKFCQNYKTQKSGNEIVSHFLLMNLFSFFASQRNLMKASLPISNPDDCKPLGQGFSSSRQICAGGKTGTIALVGPAETTVELGYNKHSVAIKNVR